MNKKDLQKILDDHLKWLRDEDGGSRADLRGANLTDADIRGANLTDADIRGANLWGANLSGATGLPIAKDYLSQFERDQSGIYVYKAIGNTSFCAPDYWKIEPMAFFEEVVNPDRCTECGCGVNFATLEWVKKNHPDSDIWKCLILWEDMADVVVPFNTDGKARCARLQLIEVVK